MEINPLVRGFIFLRKYRNYVFNTKMSSEVEIVVEIQEKISIL